jgi:hypothetical protein
MALQNHEHTQSEKQQYNISVNDMKNVSQQTMM